MIDVSPKFNTLRYAKAQGILKASPEIIKRIADKSVPKGDVYQVARAAGINAAKNAASWITFCHTLPLDWVGIDFDFHNDHIVVSAEVKAVWKTGVEMEAMTAVSAALLNAYDMLKPLSDDISFSDVKLVKKKGGKSSFKDEFASPLKIAVLVLSDSTYEGNREDKSGKIIQSYLKEKSLETEFYEILPDDIQKIKNRLIELSDDEKCDLIFTTGGTGFGPKDFTPEATLEVIEKEAPGIVEAIRKHGKERTPYAMLAREAAGIRGTSVIINLPGSSKGAEESLQALFPGLLHAFPMLWGGGHDGNKKWVKK
ncbi:MAG: bifunctional molybdenum cofactor biosynthesis protein MoaC/MoaB [Calditrichaeota bacterium]|nr:MAG: bifunctional molybdenum cofactor biosynthesis protein MoaC/MoaB [Calditrichota bacterium]MBL1205720.1 bifunctional molybdenum cofactor biosynthesis protein MoaC/MoaB [Calditrichota bacterium]NOG45548.1 bifunctional molybdenum cofactor biosynthesis protein MoaC/MoaB [Calditrichota bacterium]